MTNASGLVLDIDFAEKSGAVAGDASRYGNDGALHGCKWVEHGVMPNVPGDNVRIPDTESLSPTSAMSAFIWVNAQGGSSGGIFSHYDVGAAQRSYMIHASDTPFEKFRIYLSDNGTLNNGHFKSYDSSIVVFDNTWHLVGFTFDAGTLKLFVDGVEDTNPTKSHDDAITTIHSSTADVMLGCYLSNDVPTTTFVSSIDQVRIHNRSLNASEIKAYYDSTKYNYR